MSDLSAIDRIQARTAYPRAYASIEEQFREVAAAYDGALMTVSLFLARVGNGVKLRALVADQDQFQQWINDDMDLRKQPFSFFIEAPTALH